MIAQMTMLLRVKQLKEEQAFRQLNIKRQHVAQARAQLAEAEDTARASAAALPVREAAIWAEIMGHIVVLDDVDQIKMRVKALQEAHQRLVDAAERARHVLLRLEKELEAAIAAHREAQKQRDKYVILRDEVVAEFNALQEFKEEAEVEDLFSTPRKRPA